MEKLELTEEELQSKIADAVAKAVADKETELSKLHNEEMARQRVKADDERKKAVQKAIDDANLTAEEKAKKEREEAFAEISKENAELKAYKQNGLIKDALIKEKLPIFLVNDGRLQNAKTDEDLAKAIELVKADFTSSIPTGVSSNTNINVGGGTGGKTEKELKMEQFAKMR